jgi:plastocyanin
VIAREFQLSLSRLKVPAGDLTVEFNTMFAEDPHDLVVVGDDDVVMRFDESPPGWVGWKTTRLKPGAYLLFCSLPEHEQLGMRANLNVTG